jgi:hypothetical protein
MCGLIVLKGGLEGGKEFDTALPEFTHLISPRWKQARLCTSHTTRVLWHELASHCGLDWCRWRSTANEWNDSSFQLGRRARARGPKKATWTGQSKVRAI